jgi:hypothetical protein
MKIKDNIKDIYKYTNIGNSIAVITDCTGFEYFGQQKWISDAAIP